MKRLAVFSMLLLSFGILSANCAAPIELMLENTVEAPQQVHLTYGYDTASWGNEGVDDTVAYRARQEGNELIIRKITINGIFSMDIGTDPCVPAGTWTYVIPFSCNSVSCGCQNYASITIPEHGANCIDASEPGDITAEEFAAKQRSETWYENPEYEYPEDEPVVDDDPAINEFTPGADDTVTPDDETGNDSDEVPDACDWAYPCEDSIMVTDETSQDLDIGNDQVDNAVTPTDTDTAVIETKKESSGCSLILL